jgi:hypothetical protein
MRPVGGSITTSNGNIPSRSNFTFFPDTKTS